MTEAGAPLPRLLLVEDDWELAEQLRWALKGEFAVAHTGDAAAGRAQLDEKPDLCLFDLRLPPSGRIEEGLSLLTEARRRDPDATVVMMSGDEDRQAALRSIELGAFDFFRKPVDGAELLIILRRALERHRLLEENRELKQQAREEHSFDRLIGRASCRERV